MINIGWRQYQILLWARFTGNKKSPGLNRNRLCYKDKEAAARLYHKCLIDKGLYWSGRIVPTKSTRNMLKANAPQWYRFNVKGRDW